MNKYYIEVIYEDQKADFIVMADTESEAKDKFNNYQIIVSVRKANN